ncbi:MAG TPA: FdrA family protein, partial [Candidatus Ozemobacteraceae bacterium]|nr:FdrA family protein [Candidatus Ozemobacteraceae bacterium]
MAIRFVIRKDAYFDSVTLMLINSEVKKLPQVESAVVGMATDYNLDSLKRLGLMQPEMTKATPSDLVLCVKAATEKVAEEALVTAEKLLTARKKGGKTQDLRPSTLEKAFQQNPDSNIVLISVPGAFAARETETALRNNRHVMLFSDNVSVADEIRLKELACKKGLLVMGPDCGTAIINGVPLAFANVVRSGPIGLVAASGTGLQEVTSLIHSLGSGITQAIGVGGRDLSEKVGGLMTLQAVKALAHDDATKVLVLISKPPAESTMVKLFKELKNVKKPVVVYFIGADRRLIENEGHTAAANLEEAAIQACRLAGVAQAAPLMSDKEIAKLAKRDKIPGKYLRALYSGGTLCDESQRLLHAQLPNMHSNTPVKGVKEMKDPYQSEEHVIIDLGDDQFTRGKAHPMIDPSYRQERIVQEMKDRDVALIAFDVVLGYASLTSERLG